MLAIYEREQHGKISRGMPLNMYMPRFISFMLVMMILTRIVMMLIIVAVDDFEREKWMLEESFYIHCVVFRLIIFNTQ